MKKIVFILLGILLILPGCVSAVRYDGEYIGRVIDATTGEPIEGAVILGVWYTEYYGAGGAVHQFYDAKETVTDKGGNFSISGQGIEVMSNVTPMSVLIFKAGYEYIGMGHWSSFKNDKLLKEKIKWEGSKAIVPLKKLTMGERIKQGSPDYPAEAPRGKIMSMLEEINKDRTARGLRPVN